MTGKVDLDNRVTDCQVAEARATQAHEMLRRSGDSIEEQDIIFSYQSRKTEIQYQVTGP